MEKEEELFNYLNNKEYPKGSSKDDKRKLRLVKIIYFGPKMSFFLHFSKKQKIDHFWLTEKAITFEQLNQF
jgi:hypothetical protein